MYDRFMGNSAEGRDLATMVGVKVNLPARLTRRDGAVAEAQARIAERRADLDRLTDQVNYEVQQAYVQVEESREAAHLFKKKILPAADLNVKSAEKAYAAGKIPFLSLIEAQRSVVNLNDQYHEAVAEYFRRQAALERVIGGRRRMER